jgi:O-antigen/teichoic acid export membrane protein
MGRFGEFARAIKASKGKKALGRALSTSVLNQIVSSSANFAFVIYLVRSLTPEEFGLYGVGFAFSLFIVGIGNALFLTQMVVHTPDKPPSERVIYAARIFLLLLLFCSCVAIAVPGISLLFLSCLPAGFSVYFNLAFAVAIAAPIVLAKEYFVRHAYNWKRETEALKINVVNLVALAFVLLSVDWSDYPLSPHASLILYALPHGVAAAAGFIRAKLPLAAAMDKQVLIELREVWAQGKWAVVQSILSLLRTQAHVFIGMAFIGATAVGLINATRVLVSPVLFVLPAISQILMPRLASMRADLKRAIAVTEMAASSLVVLSLLYAMFLLLYSQDLSELALGDAYASNEIVFDLIVCWCIVMCVQVAQTCFSTLAQSLKLFRHWAYWNGIAALASAEAVRLRILAAIMEGSNAGSQFLRGRFVVMQTGLAG